VYQFEALHLDAYGESQSCGTGNLSDPKFSIMFAYQIDSFARFTCMISVHKEVFNFITELSISSKDSQRKDRLFVAETCLCLP
jgi:hypothetical protein